jgi:aminoglycoside phosphotransferase (APT) family kinase protein
LDALAADLGRAFPALTPLAPLRLLGYGFSSIAVETPGGIVFRVARTPEAGAQYAREAVVLPSVRNLPVAIPRPEWFVASSDAFSYGLIGYRKLPGNPPEPNRLEREAREALADQLGVLILALQRVPLETIPAGPDPSARQARWARLRVSVLPVLRERLRPGEYARVAAWWETFLADEALRDYAPVFQHGDLWYGNLLVEGDRLVGLVDFEEAGRGDPAQDFVPQLYLGERFLGRVMAAFRQAGGAFDTGFERRLAALWALREFGGLEYAIRYDDRAELAETLDKIRKGPILSRYGLDGWG